MYVVVIVSKKSSFKYMDHTCWNKPQGQKNDTPGRPSDWIFELQIKNIKLHIVTDIKVLPLISLIIDTHMAVPLQVARLRNCSSFKERFRGFAESLISPDQASVFWSIFF